MLADHRDITARVDASGWTVTCACGDTFHGDSWWDASLKQRIHRTKETHAYQSQ